MSSSSTRNALRSATRARSSSASVAARRRTSRPNSEDAMASVDLKNPAFQKLVLSAVAAGALLYVFFFTHVLPFGFPNQQERVHELKTTYEKKATDLARAKTTVADLPRFEAEYGQLHEQWILAAELLPTDKDLP